MKKLFCGLLTSLLCLACQEQSTDSAFLLTKLGQDTLAIERFKVQDQSLVADVILRSPRISLQRYEMNWDENEEITNMAVYDYTDANSFSNGQGKLVQKLTNDGDSLSMIYYNEKGDRIRKIPNRSNLIPFVDMVHWPYEIAFNRAAENPTDSIDQFMITGRRHSNFIIHRVDDTSYTLRHPSRGVMEVTTSKTGELLSLDAGQTTRKLKVERAFDLTFDQLAAYFAEKDQVNSPFGTLSPPISNQYKIGDADFEVNYGSPAKRGRKIFGGIVPYSQLWRTGANRATHFKTSKDLMIQGQQVPAGEYTLFTIPEATEGTLILNRQTGQNGRSYDASRDLMRVKMNRSDGNPTVESFTIMVKESSESNRLNLMWDDTIYWIAFEIL
jgi:hypothetical protein